MLDRISFVIGEGFVALRRNLAMAFAGITTGAVALFLLGLLSFALHFASDYAQMVPGMFDMRVFLKQDTSFDKIKETAKVVRSMPGIAKVTLIPKERAWLKMQHDQPNLTRGIDNPLPDQLRIILADIRRGDLIAGQIQNLPTVEPDGVHYLRQEQRLASAVLETFRIVGPGLWVLLIFATGILIYNTIRMTVLSRRLEIRIMQLVGAPRSMVKVPFLIEGVVQGFLGGVMAAVLLFLSYEIVRNQLMDQDIQFAAFPTTQAFLLLSGIGAGYGLLCSVLAVRVPLIYR